MIPAEFLEAGGTFILVGVLGFAIRRGSVCAVAATELWIVKRRTARIRAFVIAGASAGTVILPLSWLDPHKFALALSYPVTVQILLAGAVFGLAARLNRACAFGTLAHLTGGRLAYAFTIIGMVGGGVFGSLMLPEGPAGAVSPVAHPSPAAFAALALFIFLAIPALRVRHFSNLRAAFGGKALLRPMTAMLVIGIVGGLLYAAAGDWTYLSALEREAYPEAADDSGRLSSVLGVVAIVGGGVYAAVRSRRFAWRLPSLEEALRCTIGGLGMGIAASAIPGGNASLLIYAVPSAAPQAIAAYSAMSAALALSFLPRAWRSSHSRQE